MKEKDKETFKRIQQENRAKRKYFLDLEEPKIEEFYQESIQQKFKEMK
ncbi:hypothetical protein [Nitratiruptor sp. SB155-2]|nr:hypothetical protein [Nitratiruptor sp. SB155-2]